MVNDGGGSWGVSWIDYDNDGDLDLFVTNKLNQNEHNALFRNNVNRGTAPFTISTSTSKD